MRYRLPELKDEMILKEYMQEHYDYGESSISASLGLPVSDYQDWVRKILKNATEGDDSWGKSLLYLCFHEDQLIGLLSIRYKLTKELSDKYGDIGYGVRPSERRHGYATIMLHHAIDVCKEKGMREIILGCYQDNLASSRTIRKNGGVLIEKNENYHEGRIGEYYRIKL